MILEQQQVTEERRWRIAECVLSVSSAEIERVPDSLLTAVVLIVAKRADLGFKLDGGNELLTMKHEDVPVLGRPEEARQGQRAARRNDIELAQPIPADDFADQGEEAMKVFSGCDASPGSRVDRTLFALPGGGCLAGFPEVSDGTLRPLFIVGQIDRHGW